jgi:hypothetical protein
MLPIAVANGRIVVVFTHDELPCILRDAAPCGPGRKIPPQAVPAAVVHPCALVSLRSSLRTEASSSSRLIRIAISWTTWALRGRSSTRPADPGRSTVGNAGSTALRSRMIRQGSNSLRLCPTIAASSVIRSTADIASDTDSHAKTMNPRWPNQRATAPRKRSSS